MQYALALLLLTQSQSATEFVIPAAEVKFAADVGKAEADLAKIKQTAGAARLKVYKDKLSEATKAGDFDKATQIKARIETLESEPEAKAHKRPRPKDTVRFDGHAYALIKEPATWHVAKQRCEEMGGHLVCIESVQELDFVLGITQSNKLEAWLGGTDEESEGDWKWVTGASIPNAMISMFKLDNHQESQHCLSAGASRNVEDNCPAYRRQFICEWDR